MDPKLIYRLLAAGLGYPWVPRQRQEILIYRLLAAGLGYPWVPRRRQEILIYRLVAAGLGYPWVHRRQQESHAHAFFKAADAQKVGNLSLCSHAV